MARFIVALGFFAITAHAQTVGLHIASVHSGDGMNNINPGAYVRFGNGITAGAYLNSRSRMSAYAGYTLETRGDVRFAITAGLISGYKGNVALLVPSVAYRNVRIGFVPRPPVKGSCAALHLMWEL